jgi:hypothetical protein
MSSQGVTPKFCTLGDVLMGKRDDPQKQTTNMLQQVTKHSKNMFVILLETLRLKLINQQVLEERVDPKFSRTCKNSNPKTKT